MAVRRLVEERLAALPWMLNELEAHTVVEDVIGQDAFRTVVTGQRAVDQQRRDTTEWVLFGCSVTFTGWMRRRRNG